MIVVQSLRRLIKGKFIGTPLHNPASYTTCTIVYGISCSGGRSWNSSSMSVVMSYKSMARTTCWWWGPPTCRSSTAAGTRFSNSVIFWHFCQGRCGRSRIRTGRRSRRRRRRRQRNSKSVFCPFVFSCEQSCYINWRHSRPKGSKLRLSYQQCCSRLSRHSSWRVGAGLGGKEGILPIRPNARWVFLQWNLAWQRRNGRYGRNW